MRTRLVFRGFLWFAVVVGMICIIYFNFSQYLPGQKEQFLKDTVSILKQGVEIVDDIRENEDGTRILMKTEVKKRAEAGVVSGKEGVINTRGKEGVINTRGKEGVINTRGKEGVIDTGGKVDKHGEKGVVDTRDQEGVVDTRGKEGVVDTRGKEGVVNTRGKEGVVNTPEKEGVVDKPHKEAQSDTRRKKGDGLDSKDTENSAIKEFEKDPKRLSLIIIGHDRSGTTFINRMFDEDPNVFNVYEPLWVTKGFSPPEKHRGAIIDAMNGILNCKFSATKNGIKFLADISRWIAVRINCKAMMSEPFCKIKNGERVCENMPPGLTDEVCATRYKYSVTKLAVARIPNENISSILQPLLDANPHTRVLYLLRDPRGTINSRINAGWLKEYPDPDLESRVQSICDATTYNFKYMQILMKRIEYKDRCMIVRYKDISANALDIATKIYSFARFEIEPRLTDWVLNHTRPSKEKLNIASYDKFSVVRNATGNADKWRKESPAERVRIINKLCAPLLRLLGISD